MRLVGGDSAGGGCWRLVSSRLCIERTQPVSPFDTEKFSISPRLNSIDKVVDAHEGTVDGYIGLARFLNAAVRCRHQLVANDYNHVASSTVLKVASYVLGHITRVVVCRRADCVSKWTGNNTGSSTATTTTELLSCD